MWWIMSKEINIPCQTFIRAMQCDCGGEMKYEPIPSELQQIE